MCEREIERMKVGGKSLEEEVGWFWFGVCRVVIMCTLSFRWDQERNGNLQHPSCHFQKEAKYQSMNQQLRGLLLVLSVGWLPYFVLVTRVKSYLVYLKRVIFRFERLDP